MKNKKTKLKTIFDVVASFLVAGAIGYFIYNVVDLNQRITQKDKEYGALEGKMKKLEDSNLELLQDKATLEIEKAQEEQKRKQKEEENRDLKTKNDNLNKKVRDLQNLNAAQRNDNLVLRSKNIGLCNNYLMVGCKQ